MMNGLASQAALFGSSLTNEVGLRVLLSPLSSNIVVRTACCSVGIGLPVYCTFKAIEKKDQNEQQRWLVYWAAYGSFSLVEVFADKFVSWFPYYYHLKFAFLIWLQLPSTAGADILYNQYIRPFMLRHQARVDRLLDCAYEETVKMISAHQAEIRFAKAVITKILGSGEAENSSSSSLTGQTVQEVNLPDQDGQDTTENPTTTAASSDAGEESESDK